MSACGEVFNHPNHEPLFQEHPLDLQGMGPFPYVYLEYDFGLSSTVIIHGL